MTVGKSQDPKPDPGRKTFRLLAEYSSIIFLLPSALLGGYFLGYLLDGYFHTTPWLSLIFLFAGAVAGFIEVFRITTRKR